MPLNPYLEPLEAFVSLALGPDINVQPPDYNLRLLMIIMSLPAWVYVSANSYENGACERGGDNPKKPST